MARSTWHPAFEELEGLSLLSFAPATSITVAPELTAVTTDDFNRDGKADLAVASAGNGTVTVLLGNGDAAGTVAEAPGGPIPVGINPLFLTSGDLNRDGIPDLVVANNGQLIRGGGSDPGRIDVLLGNGNGTFRQAPGSPFAPGNSPAGVAVADFNGDGFADLAVACTGYYRYQPPFDFTLDTGCVRIYHGNGSGSFTLNATFNADTSSAIGRIPVGVSVANLDADNRPDLIVASPGLLLQTFLGTVNIPGQVSVLLNTGSGFTAAPGSPYATGNQPVYAAPGDFNGDRRADLAVVNSNALSNAANGNTVTVLINQGGASFTQAVGSPIAVGRTPTFAIVADFNNDRRSDLAVTSNADGIATVLQGNGAGQFTAATLAVGGHPGGAAVADFNGDDVPDLAVAGTSSNTLSILLKQARTTTEIVASAGTVWVGTPITLTATIRSAVAGPGIPTGEVVFQEGTTELGRASLDGSNQAALRNVRLSLGHHSITAVYKGDGTFFSSTSPTPAEVSVIPKPPPPEEVSPRGDVTALVGFQSVRLVRLKGGQRLRQTVTLRNTSGLTIRGPLMLVLDSLGRRAKLVGASGSTRGSPYRVVALDGLAPGESRTLVLQFTNPKGPVVYAPRILAGDGF